MVSDADSSSAGALPIQKLEQVTSLIEETAGRPVRSAALFYALYYLVEIEGRADAAYDFKRVRDRLCEGFWWYGFYATLREFSNAGKAFYIDGVDARLLEPEEISAKLREWDVHPQRADEVGYLIPRFDQWRREVGPTGANVLNFLVRAERDFKAVTYPTEALQTVHAFFEEAPSAGTSAIATISTEERTGWLDTYNGAGWTSIVSFLLQRESMTATMWVDQAFSVEHNNRGWFDKIAPASADLDVAERHDLSPPGMPRPALTALQALLDANHEGDMTTVFAVAAEFDGEVGINLRRAAIESGFDPTP